MIIKEIKKGSNLAESQLKKGYEVHEIKISKLVF